MPVREQPVMAPMQDAPEAGAGGAAGAAGAPEVSEPDDPKASCIIGKTCVTHQCPQKPVSCEVQSIGVTCELEEFVGASAPAVCGGRVQLGIACCGTCGCVPVELFFDGRKCWEGIPQCGVEPLTGAVFGPHDPGPATRGIYLPPGVGLGVGGGDSSSGGSGGSNGGVGGTGSGGLSGQATAGEAGVVESVAGGASVGGAAASGGANAVAGSGGMAGHVDGVSGGTAS